MPQTCPARNELCKLVTGIEPTGNMVKQPAKFTVDTISAGQGEVMVFIEDPEGNKEEVGGGYSPPRASRVRNRAGTEPLFYSL